MRYIQGVASKYKKWALPWKTTMAIADCLMLKTYISNFLNQTTPEFGQELVFKIRSN